MRCVALKTYLGELGKNMPDRFLLNSYYHATANQQLAFPVLDKNSKVDVCIIGGGYSGLNTALELQQKGIEAVILEAETVAFGASGRNGGQVHAGLRLTASELITMFGEAKAKELWALSEEAKEILLSRLRQYHIQCDYQPGLLVAAAKSSHLPCLLEDVEVAQKIFGYPHARFLKKEEIQEIVASKNYCGGMIDSGAGHLHPLNYALGLAAACQKNGIKIYEKTRVIEVKRTDSGSGYVIRSLQGEIHAKKVVMCCNAYLFKLQKKLASRIMPIVNFILATEPLGIEKAQQLIKQNLAICDTKFVVNYYRFSKDYRLIYGGGETYTNHPPHNMKEFVRKFMLRTFPQLEDIKIDYAWGGKLAITTTRLPDIGQLFPGFYYAHGYSGQGLSMTGLAGRLIAEAITGELKRFNLIASLPNQPFPGGTLLRWPLQVAAMLWFSLRDKL